ncbi:hypothetical protein OGAPHI_002967 [Ogataea philodendri]|uniref:glycogenin glucosyltransferase n=2 Tax=Ogataea TaxID=461281 RepID=A0A9P8P851_9ASCO|nr:uncharacterized protein OGAPHI_002967 [Ogataea philodendri]KAH3667318.1 hypothetical protein OGAPHI_002967 [Ogataea philodendri]
MSAYALLLLEDSYLPGILAVSSALTATSTKFPLVLLYSDKNIDQNIVKLLIASGLFAQLINIDNGLLPSNSPHTLDNVLKRPELSLTISKINLWKLTQFSKLVYLDADTLPLQNLDHLFDLEFSSNQIVAASDIGWPDLFNTGVFVLQPNLAVYKDLLQLYESTESFDGADQGLLNEHFNPDLYHGGVSNWIRLPFIYNCTLNSHYEYFPALQRYSHDVKLFHFIGSKKPWHPHAKGLKDDPTLFKVSGNQNVYQLWSQAYEKVTIDGKSHIDILRLSRNLQPEPNWESVAAVQTPVHPQFYYKKPESVPDSYSPSHGEAWKLKDSKISNKWDKTGGSDDDLDAEKLVKSLSQLDVASPEDTYATSHPVFPWEKSSHKVQTTRSFQPQSFFPKPSNPFTASFDNGSDLESYIAKEEQSSRPETLEEIKQDEKLDALESEQLDALE